MADCPFGEIGESVIFVLLSMKKKCGYKKQCFFNVDFDNGPNGVNKLPQ